MDEDDIVDDTPFGGDGSEELEEEIAKRREERAAALGFYPQKEVIYNSILPYADKLDEESTDMWNEIKLNLGRAIALRELRPGYVMWTGRLTKFLKMYGYKFSKEDHVALVNLLMSVLITPDLDPFLINRTVNNLISLTKKKELLTPSDLQIEWRPLYELYEKLFYSPYEALGMLHYPSSDLKSVRSLTAQIDKLEMAMAMLQTSTHFSVGVNNATQAAMNKSPLESNLRTLISYCRPYFDVNATREMLEEWRPLMCPFDVTMAKAMSYCEMFLPTFDSYSRKEQTFQLWFDELMAFWEACPNQPLFEPHLFGLFARMADHTRGYFDWSKHISLFLTRIHHSFDLPVTYKGVGAGRKLSVDISTSVKWILAVMNKNPEIFKSLEQMFSALDSYYNTANYGRHSMKLTDFLYKLVSSFVFKIYRERYAKKRTYWGPEVPQEFKISDAQITTFVKILMPVVLNGMYFKAGEGIFSKILQNLAFLRPELVIPPVMDRLFTAFETLTEPHKLTANMTSVCSMARSIVHPGGEYCKEAPTQVIPLLINTLPAIDSNDVGKSMVAFQLISIYCTIIPIVDSSQAGQFFNDMTEEERLICSQTAQFEDFIVQFLDRCFAFIESSTLQQTREETSISDHRANREESMKDIGMASTFNVILIHSSEALYNLALKKVQSFVKGRILETKIAGRIAASLCRCLVRARPEKGLAAFVPDACRIITELLTEDMINHEDLIDEELKFNMHVLSECVRGRGIHILPYLDKIKVILSKSLRMKSKEGQASASIILRNLLRSLTAILSEDYRSCPEGYDRPISECLPIRLWGKPGNIHNLQMKWSLPSKEELQAAQDIIDEFLGKELTSIRDLVAGKVELNKEQLQNSLSIICGIIIGAGNYIPKLSDNPDAVVKTLSESVTKLDPLQFRVHVDGPSLTFGGADARRSVVEVLELLQDFLLKHRADDHKSLSFLISAYDCALHSCGISRQEYERHRQSLSLVKGSLENRLIGSRKTIRPLLIDRAMIQHESRLNESFKTTFTETHHKVMLNLLKLATSHYANVRIRAQDTLQQMTLTYAYSYKVLLDPLLQLLSGDNSEEKVSHEAFKGALYTLIGHKDKTMLTKHDWSTLSKVWPSLLLSRHSEKPSIAKLLDQVSRTLRKHSETFALETQVSEKAVNLALAILPPKNKPSENELEKAKNKCMEVNAKNIGVYENLVDKLCEELETRKLHWRHYNLGLEMLTILTRCDKVLPARAVKLMVENLTHENLVARKCSIHVLGSILKQHKRKHPKVKIAISDDDSNIPGDREGNLWLCYDKDKVPKSQEEWDQPRYVHKTHFGYYKWPSEMLAYAPSDQQPKLERKIDEMSAEEQEIYKFFINESKVSKLIEFLSLEERKGQDRFDARRFFMFKGLFRNFGDTFLHLFRQHLERLVDQDQESAHRCAAEIIAGVIRGMKHWPWNMTVNCWQWLQPLLRKVVSKITVESFGDWGTCFATASESRDPHRIHWMLEALMEEPVQSKGSFNDCSRLYALQGALAQQEWRIPTLMNKLLEELKPFLTHSFMSVRDRLGSMITNIFISDLDFSAFPTSNGKNQGGNRRNPKVIDFIHFVLPQLEMLASSEDCSENGSSGSKTPSEVPIEAQMQQQPMMKMMPPPPDMLRAMGPMMRMPPPPEMMMRMPMGGPGMRMPPPAEMLRMLPPELMQRMPMGPGMGPGMRMPPPAEMLRMLPPEMLMRPPPPEVAKMMNFELPPEPMNGVDPEKEEKKKAIRLLQAVCKCIGGCLVRDFVGIRAEYYKLLPMLCNHESNEIETHLARDCTITLGYMSQAMLPLATVPACLEAINQVSKSGSWKARASVLELLQVTVFLNMPSLLSDVTWVHQVMDVVERGLIDERVEVRSKAGQVLGGLLHCAFVDKERQDSLLKSFYAKVRSKKKKKAKLVQEDLVSKHSGVLGLCAFVNAFPYDVPEFVPDILMVLSDHLHDPQPIPVTIKKTLQDFKRTHQDNWQDHKLKFSDDQLAVLTDLLVSPSYYA